MPQQPPSTEIVLIVDCSNSMVPLADAVVENHNAFLDEQRRLPGQTWVTLVFFSTEFILAADAEPLELISPLTRERYRNSQGTALYDAVGKTLEHVYARRRTAPLSRRPEKVVVAVITDGIENSSRFYTDTAVRNMIAHLRDKEGWAFLFFAANQNLEETATQIGFQSDECRAWVPTADGTQEMHRLLSREMRAIRTREITVRDLGRVASQNDEKEPQEPHGPSISQC